jgi:uncharacterized LabA/DUF88 family protein
MNDKDLPTTNGPHGNAAALTPPAANDTSGTARPRRHRRPARGSRAENGVPAEAIAEAKPAEENTANSVADAGVSAENASAPAETNRPARRRGRTRKAAPAEEAAGEHETAPAAATPAPDLLAPEAGQTHETSNALDPPPLPAAARAAGALPAAANEPHELASAAAPPPPAPANESEATTPPAEEAPRHRYRFDRRTVSATFPTTSAPAPAPPAGALRRPGPLSSQWARPAAPPPVKEEEAAPEPLAPPPARTAPPPPANHAAPAGQAPVAHTPPPAPEPEEIVLPRVPAAAARPAQPAPPEPLPAEIQIDEGDETFTVTPVPTPDEATASANERRGRRRRRGGRNGLAHESEERPAQAAATAPTLAAPRYQQPPTVTPPPPEATPSPYGSPEPASARGFGPTPRGVASEYRGQSPFSHGRLARTGGEGGPPISANHLASIIMEAMQQQTDRLLSEQRRHGQASSFTIAMPSTERVGVFVDVANLLYSSRSMRLPIDFGRLLNFLRADRRLVRAHAYCPTSPEPYADQQFLQAVKGLGYRITTKDYKTFSSGAKKADLDLDLCMDIVRIVDAKAVDTVVLVSGDSDFLPLLDYCSDHGVRVEVAAFDESTAAILRQSCDLFLNLSVVEEIRADR